MTQDSIDYTHGDTGSKPAGSLNFQENERPDAQTFDWFWTTVIDRINALVAGVNALDSTGNGVADEAANADTLDGNHASAFATSGHDHDGRYYTESETDANFAAAGHTHDGRYYTQSQVDSNFAAAGHNHDGTYYQESEVLEPYRVVLPVGTDAWA